ncbi:site-specific integrase [soil metagenome]
MHKTTLTDRTVAAATAPEGKRLELWDTRQSGLCLRVTDRGVKTWVYRYRTSDGRQPRHTIGKMPAVTLKEARTAAASLALEVATGGDPASERKRERAFAAGSMRTFDDLADLYEERCASGDWMPKGKRKRSITLVSEEGVLRRNIRPVIGKTPYTAITKADVRAVLRKMTSKGIGAQANKTHAVIRQVYNFAISEDLVQINPAIGVNRPSEIKPRVRIWTDAELKQVWAALSDYENIIDEHGERVTISEMLALALKLAMVLGQRRSEIIGMEVAELDFAAKTWTIPAGRMKANRPHLVPLSDTATDLIKKAIEVTNRGRNSQSDYVFRTTWEIEKPVEPGSMTRAMKRVSSALEIPNATVHDLRRTMSSTMTSERLKINPFIRSLILAHSTTGGGAAVSSAHYDVNPYISEKRDALDRWAALLMRIVGDKDEKREQQSFALTSNLSSWSGTETLRSIPLSLNGHGRSNVLVRSVDTRR